MPACSQVRLQRCDDSPRAGGCETKYGSDWHFHVQDGAFHSGDGNSGLVFRAPAATAFGFVKGQFGQTRRRCTAAGAPA
ncbi:MAG: hypothetical protein H0U09_15270 [Geodermatophilaceae bacterium]|nr:hypothetical protein [Geodermatophilaceae bacterium]